MGNFRLNNSCELSCDLNYTKIMDDEELLKKAKEKIEKIQKEEFDYLHTKNFNLIMPPFKSNLDLSQKVYTDIDYIIDSENVFEKMNILKSNMNYMQKCELLYSFCDEKIKEYLNLDKENYVSILQKNTTNAINYASRIIEKHIINNMLQNIDEEIRIIYCNDEHGSTISPFLRLKKHSNVVLDELNFNNEWDYDVDKIISILKNINDNKEKRSKIFVIFNLVSSIYGVGFHDSIGVFKYKLEKEIGLNNNIYVLIDLSGSIRIEENKINFADAIFFQGIKFHAKNSGMGIYSKRFLELDNNEFEKKYSKDGTKNYENMYSIYLGLKKLRDIGYEYIQVYINDLVRYLYKNILSNQYYEMLIEGNDPRICNFGYGILSFRHKYYSSIDIQEILLENNIEIRSSNECMNIQHDEIRVCMGLHTKREDVELLIKLLSEIK